MFNLKKIREKVYGKSKKKVVDTKPSKLDLAKVEKSIQFKKLTEEIEEQNRNLSVEDILPIEPSEVFDKESESNSICESEQIPTISSNISNWRIYKQLADREDLNDKLESNFDEICSRKKDLVKKPDLDASSCNIIKLNRNRKRKLLNRFTKEKMLKLMSNEMDKSDSSCVNIPVENVPVLEATDHEKVIKNPSFEKTIIPVQNNSEEIHPDATSLLEKETSHRKEMDCENHERELSHGKELDCENRARESSHRKEIDCENRETEPLNWAIEEGSNTVVPYLENGGVNNSSSIDKFSRSEYLDIFKVSETCLLVAFHSCSTLYLKGNVWVKQLIGKTNILGYDLKQNESYPVFSPSNHSLIYIESLKGEIIKEIKEETINELNIPSHFLSNLSCDKSEDICVIKLDRYTSRESLFLQSCNINYDRHMEQDTLFKVLGINIAQPDCYQPTMKESLESKGYLDQLLQLPEEERLCIVIGGGKGVGKSTFIRYSINKLLKKFEEVACIDLDPGQPEFSLPGCLTYTVINQPLLGPSYTNLEHCKYSFQKKVLFGHLSVDDAYNSYYQTIDLLVDAGKEYNKIPIVVNTMGYTKGYGLKIMMDILMKINPSHVIILKSDWKQTNFDVELLPDTVNGESRCKDSKQVNYIYKEIDSMVEKNLSSRSKELREVRMLYYLSKLWKKEETCFVLKNLLPVVKIPWSSVALHLIAMAYPLKWEYILEPFMNSLVALCSISREYIEETGEEKPMKLSQNSSWYKHNNVLGWGIVRYIDPDTREIHLLSPLSEENVLQNVNLFIKTKNGIPSQMENIFYNRSFGPAPYISKPSSQKERNNNHSAGNKSRNWPRERNNYSGNNSRNWPRERNSEENNWRRRDDDAQPLNSQQNDKKESDIPPFYRRR